VLCFLVFQTANTRSSFLLILVDKLL